MVTVLGDRELAVSMGTAGRARAERDFALDRHVDAFEALFERLIGAVRRVRLGAAPRNEEDDKGTVERKRGTMDVVEAVSDPEPAVSVDPRREAFDRVGGRFDVRVLEPSPPAVNEAPWFADDPIAHDPRTPGLPLLGPVSNADLTWDDVTRLEPDLADFCAARWLGACRRLRPIARPRRHDGDPRRTPRGCRVGRGSGTTARQRQDRPAIHDGRVRDAVLRTR